MGIIILHSLQVRVLLENTTFLLHKIVRNAGIIRVAGIIRGRALYEEIRYSSNSKQCEEEQGHLPKFGGS